VISEAVDTFCTAIYDQISCRFIQTSGGIMKRTLSFVLATMCIGLTACGGSDSNASGSPEPGTHTLKGEPIRIGFTTTDSGPRQQPAFADGFQAWVDQLNQQGGIDGRPVEMVRCDTEADATKTQQCAQSFVADADMPAVAGWGALLAAGPIELYAKEKMPFVSVASFTSTEYAAPTSISILGALAAAYPPLMEHVKDEGAQSIAFLRADIAGTVDAAAEYKGQAEKLGLKWLGDVAVAADAPDVLPNVTAVLKDKPDVLLAQVHPAILASTLDALSTLGSDVKVLSAPASVTPDVLANPAAADRLLFPTPFAQHADDDPDYAYLKDRFGDDLTQTHVEGYIQGRAIQQAIEKSGGADATRKSVLDFVLTGKFTDLPWLPEAITRSDAPAKYPALANVANYVLEADGAGGSEYVSDLIEPEATIFN
jgi:branched-chain amino acid transport system substrate-binding protein